MPVSELEMSAGMSRRQFMKWGAAAATGALLGGNLSLRAQSDDSRIIRHVYTNARKVSLTYDDLWSEFFSLKIGREYRRRNVRLTLFPVGLAVLNNLDRPNAGYENLYPRLRDMGHEFGCHLFTHRDITGFSLQQLIDEEFQPALYVMRRALGPGFRPVGIRPPYGIVTDALRELSDLYGIPLILWGLDSQDAICARNNRDKTCDCEKPPNGTSLRTWGMESQEAICAEDSCPDDCVEAILTSYESYLRPGTIILHHTLEASFQAIQPTLNLLRDWNMQPIPLSQLLTLAA